MDRTTVLFIRASLIYLAIGVVVGVLMAAWPQWIYVYRSVHVHLNLLGFMTMMVFGVGNHILPRFSGRPLYSQEMARVQFWLANIGLIGMILSWSFLGHRRALAYQAFLVFFGAIEAIAILIFVYNIQRTIRPIGG